MTIALLIKGQLSQGIEMTHLRPDVMPFKAQTKAKSIGRKGFFLPFLLRNETSSSESSFPQKQPSANAEGCF